LYCLPGIYIENVIQDLLNIDLYEPPHGGYNSFVYTINNVSKSPLPKDNLCQDKSHLIEQFCLSFHHFFQQMRRSGNKEENKRIIMDLEVVLKCTDYPFIVQCTGCFITAVSNLPF
jgi:hypothetical protein